MRRLLAALVLAVIPASTLGFLCLPMLPAPATPYTGAAPAGTFSPTVSVTDSSTVAGAAGTLTFSIDLAQGDLIPQGVAILVPAGWGVASDAAVPDGAQVGAISGTFTASNLGGPCMTLADYLPDLFEATTDTGSPTYPAFLAALAPGTHKARYYGIDSIAGLPNAAVPVNIIVDQLPAPDNRHQLIVIVGDPATSPNLTTEVMCSPWTFALTLQGTATPGGEPLYTNPATPGAYEFSAVLASEWDADNDGYSNATDNCAQRANADQTDTDEDLMGDACDPSPSVKNTDIDSDGIANGYDNCALAPNSTQDDSDFDGLGNGCDGLPDTVTGTRYVLGCAQYLYVGVPGSGTGSCSNLTEPAPTPTPTLVPGSAVGGVAESLDLAALPAPASGAAGARRGAYASVAAGAALLAAASMSAWRARRRR